MAERLLIGIALIASVGRIERREKGYDVARMRPSLFLDGLATTGQKSATVGGDRLSRERSIFRIGRIVRDGDMGDPVSSGHVLGSFDKSSGGCDGGLGLAGIGAPALRKVGPSPAPITAQNGRHRANDVRGVHLLCLIRRHARRHGGFAAGIRNQQYNAGAHAVLMGVDQPGKVLARHAR